MKNFKIISVLSLIALFCLMAFTTISPKKMIVIDAGHGGMDDGASNEMLKEKEITEKIAKKIKALNKNSDIEIVLLRNGDQSISLQERTAKINELKPDLLISLHLSKSTNKEINGIEAIISEENNYVEKSKSWAEIMLENLKESNFEIRGVLNKKLHILRYSDCPAVLLELGFLSNERDSAVLSTEKGQRTLAEKILAGIQKQID